MPDMPANPEDLSSSSFLLSLGEGLDDYEWAYERVTRLCASALVDAQVYRHKLLKGFGYPNETFRAAQDYRALSIILGRLRSAAQALQAATERERELRQAIHPTAGPEWTHEAFLSLASAHRQDSEFVDELELEHDSIRTGARTWAELKRQLQAATERAEQAEAEIAEAKAALTEGPHGLLLTTGLGPSIRMWLSATNATRIALIERAEQAERDRDCYLKNLEDAQGDIAAEVAENQRFREQLVAADQLRVEALALVEKWRELAGDSNDDPYDPAATYNLAIEVCADDLASLLTRPPKE